MSDRIAEYDDRQLPIVRWVGACPYVFHEGYLRPATEVVIDGHGLTDIVPAPKLIGVPPGWWADSVYTPEGGAPVRESLPLLAVEVRHGGWGRGLVLNGDGIELLKDMRGRNWQFLGYRLGEPGPYCAYEDE
jgi:hypothetical protein